MQIFRDEDADVSKVSEKTIGIVGYGNQGRSQALNFRDSGLRVMVADQDESARISAQRDGFPVVSVPRLVRTADIVMLLVPDDKIPQIYKADIQHECQKGQKTLVFASGYAVAFGLVELPKAADVLLIAPRMIGKGIRSAYLDGDGFSALVAVEQDASGSALIQLLALAKALGATRGGAFMSSFKEEAIVDLFFEQTGELYAFRTMFEVLVEAGLSPEIVVLDMYGSGELAESYSAVRDFGLWKQLKLHSTTSQFGQEVAALTEFDTESARGSYRRVLKSLMDGSFSAAWQSESAAGYPELEQRRKKNALHPMQLAEDTLYTALGRRRQSESLGPDTAGKKE